MNASAVATTRHRAATRSYLWLKNWMDRLIALAVLVVAAPIFAMLIFLIRRDSPGPAIFQQTRAGLNGRPFTLLKFRTMRTDVDPYGDSPRTGEDPRITPIGRWLRERSLDELPQLLNVALGEMSLVGPRPLYLQQMAEWNDYQKRRLLVKPGLTGLAQVSGRGSLTIEEKLDLDARYVDSLSLRNDLLLIWRTAFHVSAKADIYEVRYSQTLERRSEAATSSQSL